MDFAITNTKKRDNYDNDDNVSVITENNDDNRSLSSIRSDPRGRHDKHSVTTDANEAGIHFSVREDFQFLCPPDYKVAQIIQNKSIVMLTGDTLYIYPERKKKSEVKMKEINDQILKNTYNDTVIPDEDENRNESEGNEDQIRKYHFSELSLGTSKPTSMQIFNFDKIIISFQDGRICVLLLHFMNNILRQIKPTLLFDFQSNRDYRFSVRSFSICPWVSQIPDSFNFELITFNTGDILSHWRLQIENKGSKNVPRNGNEGNLENVGGNPLLLSNGGSSGSLPSHTDDVISGQNSNNSNNNNDANSANNNNNNRSILIGNSNNTPTPRVQGDHTPIEMRSARSYLDADDDSISSTQRTKSMNDKEHNENDITHAPQDNQNIQNIQNSFHLDLPQLLGVTHFLGVRNIAFVIVLLHYVISALILNTD